jgi:hypothetical protein
LPLPMHSVSGAWKEYSFQPRMQHLAMPDHPSDRETGTPPPGLYFSGIFRLAVHIRRASH